MLLYAICMNAAGPRRKNIDAIQDNEPQVNNAANFLSWPNRSGLEIK